MEIIYPQKIKKFFGALDNMLADRMARSIDLLERYGNLLEMPMSKPLGKGLFELRVMGNTHIRIFYCFHKNRIYLLHAIVKKNRRIPKQDIRLARGLMKRIVSI